MECPLCKIQYVGKAEADFHFRKPGHSFNLHAKFTLIEQLRNIHTTDK